MGDLLVPAELEGRSERIPERKAEDAPDHAFPLVIHGGAAYRRQPEQSPLVV